MDVSATRFFTSMPDSGQSARCVQGSTACRIRTHAQFRGSPAPFGTMYILPLGKIIEVTCKPSTCNNAIAASFNNISCTNKPHPPGHARARGQCKPSPHHHQHIGGVVEVCEHRLPSLTLCSSRLDASVLFVHLRFLFMLRTPNRAPTHNTQSTHAHLHAHPNGHFTKGSPGSGIAPARSSKKKVIVKIHRAVEPTRRFLEYFREVFPERFCWCAKFSRTGREVEASRLAHFPTVFLLSSMQKRHVSVLPPSHFQYAFGRPN